MSPRYPVDVQATYGRCGPVGIEGIDVYHHIDAIPFQESAEFPCAVPEVPSHLAFEASMREDGPQVQPGMHVEERTMAFRIIIHHVYRVSLLHQSIGQPDSDTLGSTSTVDVAYRKTNVLHHFFFIYSLTNAIGSRRSPRLFSQYFRYDFQ